MQIDFHHAVTYTVARLAGLEEREAETVAYASQYVDDATNGGVIRFKNGAMYDRIATAHKMLDYRNVEELEDAKVWAAFHFLPGNGGFAADDSNNRLTHDERMVCLPNSHVAQDMVRECIRRKGDPNALHRLGITMHVYADTWAHQKFSGIQNDTNRVNALEAGEKSFGKDIEDYLRTLFVGENVPLGHGAALHFPDMPYLKWGYMSGEGEPIYRDNTEIFVEAADHLCRAMQAWTAGDESAQQAGLPESDKEKIRDLFLELKDEDGEVRHQHWLQRIRDGAFSFGQASVEYVPKGARSWKYAALGTLAAKDGGDEQFDYSPDFLASNWKYFHDAAQQHRLFVLTGLLPKYGMTAA